jgi:hypothetical protein
MLSNGTGMCSFFTTRSMKTYCNARMLELHARNCGHRRGTRCREQVAHGRLAIDGL